MSLLQGSLVLDSIIPPFVLRDLDTEKSAGPNPGSVLNKAGRLEPLAKSIAGTRIDLLVSTYNKSFIK